MKGCITVQDVAFVIAIGFEEMKILKTVSDNAYSIY